MIMYHLHRKGYADDLWTNGNVIKEYDNNFFWKMSLDFKPYVQVSGKGLYPFTNVYEYYRSMDDVLLQLNLLNKAASIIGEYQILLRESVLENIRREFFPDLPSRTKCVWLCRKNQIGYWKSRIKDETDVYKVEIDETKLFKTRSELLPLGIDSYNEIVLKAKNYFAYNSGEEFDDDEYLYCGTIKVIGKISKW